ncbi:aminotransferase class III-fold pyridoxal phosphate-dependent enzyme [Mesorhizobium abyssinicae]|uniref:aminotransferase class III-fold pyridoxal phosphate-dependent enzyme n=1 Tax=Mesorhizobium abyssinicae TaxID=1209958 RepID=UPI003391E2CE
MTEALPNSRDRSLRARSLQVIPNGIWGHMAVRLIAPEYPQFFARADGCRVWDVDGNEYIDFMCAWGPNVLGYHHPEVDQAALEQMKRMDAGNGPAEVLVDLAELLVDTVDGAAWAMFQKNGTDATTTAVTIARAATGKRKILVAKSAYHGAVPWCSPSIVGVTAEDRAHIITFEFNDIESLQAATAQAGDDLAGIMMTPYHHHLAVYQQMPTIPFLEKAREICDRAGSALILDDVRAGFRLNVRGSWAETGVIPDLACYSKAIANGWPLGAVLGNEKFREGASKIFVTGSFWYGAAPMAAAVTTIKILRDTDAIAHTAAMGQRLRDGLEEAAKRHCLKLDQSGPTAMPMVLFEGDKDLKLGIAFCEAALRRGVYFHPKHNMFLCAAHQPADIDRAVEAADGAMAEVVARGAVPA